MNIEPIEIFNNKTKCVGKLGDKDVLGYLTKFKWENGEGYAFLFPAGMGNIQLNKITSVETEQQEIRNFAVVFDSTNCDLEFRSLDTHGDYYIVGEIDIIHRDLNDDSFEVPYISVGDWSFVVTCDDITSEEFKVGDIVQFDLLGLELFDEGIY
jgi:hypothetical protein